MTTVEAAARDLIAPRTVQQHIKLGNLKARRREGNYHITAADAILSTH